MEGGRERRREEGREGREPTRLPCDSQVYKIKHFGSINTERELGEAHDLLPTSGPQTQDDHYVSYNVELRTQTLNMNRHH